MKTTKLVKGHVNSSTATRSIKSNTIAKWSVVTSWTKEDGTEGLHIHTFSRKSEALNWIRWA